MPNTKIENPRLTTNSEEGSWGHLVVVIDNADFGEEETAILGYIVWHYRIDLYYPQLTQFHTTAIAAEPTVEIQEDVTDEVIETRDAPDLSSYKPMLGLAFGLGATYLMAQIDPKNHKTYAANSASAVALSKGNTILAVGHRIFVCAASAVVTAGEIAAVVGATQYIGFLKMAGAVLNILVNSTAITAADSAAETCDLPFTQVYQTT
jgi:hypothetical protein